MIGYVAREHDRWPSSKLSGYRSPAARWYAGALEVSSSPLVVGATQYVIELFSAVHERLNQFSEPELLV